MSPTWSGYFSCPSGPSSPEPSPIGRGRPITGRHHFVSHAHSATPTRCPPFTRQLEFNEYRPILTPVSFARSPSPSLQNYATSNLPVINEFFEFFHQIECFQVEMY